MRKPKSYLSVMMFLKETYGETKYTKMEDTLYLTTRKDIRKLMNKISKLIKHFNDCQFRKRRKK